MENCLSNYKKNNSQPRIPYPAKLSLRNIIIDIKALETSHLWSSLEDVPHQTKRLKQKTGIPHNQKVKEPPSPENGIRVRFQNK